MLCRRGCHCCRRNGQALSKTLVAGRVVSRSVFQFTLRWFAPGLLSWPRNEAAYTLNADAGNDEQATDDKVEKTIRRKSSRSNSSRGKRIEESAQKIDLADTRSPLYSRALRLGEAR